MTPDRRPSEETESAHGRRIDAQGEPDERFGGAFTARVLARTPKGLRLSYDAPGFYGTAEEAMTEARRGFFALLWEELGYSGPVSYVEAR
jgi:hypothetical protein